MIQEVLPGRGPAARPGVRAASSRARSSPNAVSRAKAKGVWQFMAATGAETRAQARLVHRRAVGSREGHRWRRRISAPVATPSTATGTSRWRPTTVARAGPARDEAATVWTTSGSWPTSRARCPRETREYVPMVLAAIVIARNPPPLRLRRRGGRAAGVRQGEGPPARRPPAHRRVDGHDRRTTFRRSTRNCGGGPRLCGAPAARRYEIKVPKGGGDGARIQARRAVSRRHWRR